MDVDGSEAGVLADGPGWRGARRLLRLAILVGGLGWHGVRRLDPEGSEAAILVGGLGRHGVRRPAPERARELGRGPELPLAQAKRRLESRGRLLRSSPSAGIPGGAGAGDPAALAAHEPAYKLGTGSLVEALERGRGLVRVRFAAPQVDFAAWRHEHDCFAENRALSDKSLVKFSQDEEILSRTVSSASPLEREPRATFDVKAEVDAGVPQRLDFFRREYGRMRDAIVPLVRQELAPYAPWVVDSALNKSILRHNVYSPHGVCGEHTDYGLCSVQFGTHGGFEFELDGGWTLGPGGWVLYAGDMLEILTNGAVPALKHRVATGAGGQSHIFFVQPSGEDKVRPAAPYLDRKPARREVTYRDWHEEKKRAAFGPNADSSTE